MLGKNYIAVDISNQSIKVLRLRKDGIIDAYGSAELKDDIVEKGMIVDAAAFAAKLSEILKHTKPTKLLPARGGLQCIASLPESQLYLHYIKIPEAIKGNELDDYIKTEAAKIIPFAFEEVYCAYHVAKAEGERHATFVCAPRKVVANYVKVLTEAGIRPAALGSGFFSLGRALLPDAIGEKNYLILDIGAHAANIGVFAIDTIANFTARVPKGGEFFTETLKEQLEIEEEEAETLKREEGLSGKKGKAIHVAETLKGCLREIIEEVKQVQTYFEKATGQEMSELVLAGGSALMPGIAPFFESELGMTVRVGDPFLKIGEHALFEEDIPPIFFAGVIGLALRAENDDLPGINLLTQYREGGSDMERGDVPASKPHLLVDLRNVVNNFTARIRKKTGEGAEKSHLNMEVDVKLLLSILLTAIAIGALIYVVITYI